MFPQYFVFMTEYPKLYPLYYESRKGKIQQSKKPLGAGAESGTSTFTYHSCSFRFDTPVKFNDTSYLGRMLFIEIAVASESECSQKFPVSATQMHTVMVHAAILDPGWFVGRFCPRSLTFPTIAPPNTPNLSGHTWV